MKKVRFQTSSKQVLWLELNIQVLLIKRIVKIRGLRWGITFIKGTCMGSRGVLLTCPLGLKLPSDHRMTLN